MTLLSQVEVRPVSLQRWPRRVKGRRQPSSSVPSGDVSLFPGDQMLAVGTSAQLESLRNMMACAVAPEIQDSGNSFKIVPEALTEESFLTGKTLRGTNLRKYHCMVISVLRGSEFITNPEPDFRFQAGDTVWIAGNLAELETV